MFLVVDLQKFRFKVGRYAVSELLHGINTGSLKQFRELPGHTLYPEQIGMVGPFQYQLAADSGLFGEFRPPFGCPGPLKKIVGGLYPGILKFSGISLSYALDLNNFISHNINI